MEFAWTRECEAAFELLKQALTSAWGTAGCRYRRIGCGPRSHPLTGARGGRARVMQC